MGGRGDILEIFAGTSVLELNRSSYTRFVLRLSLCMKRALCYNRYMYKSQERKRKERRKKKSIFFSSVLFLTRGNKVKEQEKKGKINIVLAI